MPNQTRSTKTAPIDPGTRIGHVHFKVADLERSLAFYCDVLGFEISQRFDSRTALISTGAYHHLIGLNTRESLGGSPPPAGTTGLYHVAILYPTRVALADALQRLVAAGIRVDQVIDHGVSEAVYLHDPDGIGLELCWDRPREQWPCNADGSLHAISVPLSANELLGAVE